MTPIQSQFVELEKQKEKVKEFFQKLKEATEAVRAEIGLNGFFQDSEGTVYQIVEPKGKWVEYDKISYIRTRRDNEVKGDLSLDKAEAAGFAVNRKK